MNTVLSRNAVTRFGLAGAALGVIAGLIQATVGSRIPEWSGTKQAPEALGLLTVALSVLAGLAAVQLRRSHLSIRARAACAFGLVGPGLLCLTTVGRLWYLPALLLVPAGLQSVEHWRLTAATLISGWPRVLLGALGGCELLMAAGAPPLLMMVGAVGGTALVAAAWLRDRPRTQTWMLLVLGTVPFAALGWTAIVPILLPLEAVVLAAVLHPQEGRDMTTVRFVAGFGILYGVLAGLAELDATGRYGIAILVAVLATALLVERTLCGVRPAAALRDLGLARPDTYALVAATAVGGLVLSVYPIVTWLTGAHFSLKPGWPWLLLGVFAFHGLAEELVWRGYAFRRLRERHSYAVAVVASMPLVVAAHVPVVLRSGLTVGVAAMLVAAATSLPLAHLFELGRNTLWAPAILHTAIDSFKVVSVPDDAVQTFSLTLAAISLTVPMLALLARRRPVLRPSLITTPRRNP